MPGFHLPLQAVGNFGVGLSVFGYAYGADFSGLIQTQLDDHIPAWDHRPRATSNSGRLLVGFRVT